MKIIRFLALLVLSTLVYQPVHSQSLPACVSVASDADGDGFGWENSASCLVTNTSLVAPTFTNQETGSTVGLTRAIWSASDFTEDVLCTNFQFDGEFYRTSDGGTRYAFSPLSETSPFVGNVEIEDINNVIQTQTWTLDNGIYFGPSELALSPWVQIVDLAKGEVFQDSIDTLNAVRVWLTNERFVLCSTFNPFTRFVPTGSATPVDEGGGSSDVDGCDYSSAAEHDGYGWNPVTGMSCAPIAMRASDNCNYDDADQFDGWGWDPVAGQSCAPLVVEDEPTTDQDCDYSSASVNEGFGWNPITGMSCSPRT